MHGFSSESLPAAVWNGAETQIQWSWPSLPQIVIEYYCMAPVAKPFVPCIADITARGMQEDLGVGLHWVTAKTASAAEPWCSHHWQVQAAKFRASLGKFLRAQVVAAASFVTRTIFFSMAETVCSLIIGCRGCPIDYLFLCGS